MRDLRGQRFGRLLVLERMAKSASQNSTNIRWLCVCDCGKKHTSIGSHLVIGNVRSCGCLAKDKARKKIEIGTRFGNWLVLEEKVISRKNGRGNELFYFCKCICGRYRTVRGTKLRAGHSRSCGCSGSRSLIGPRSKTHGLYKTKDYNAAACSRRRARIRKAKGKHTAQELKNLYTLQRGLCFYCAESLHFGYHRDHKVPLIRGGSDSIDNIALCCQRCNNKKYTKTSEEFIQTLKKEDKQWLKEGRKLVQKAEA